MTPLSEPQQNARTSDGQRASVARIVRTALEAEVDQVTVVPGVAVGPEELRELSWALEDTGVDLVVSTDLHGIAPRRLRVTENDGRVLMRVGSVTPRGATALVKAVCDRVLGAALLVLSAPVMLLLALAVRLESPGAAFYRQTRVGVDGTTFTMIKLRSMHQDAEARLQELLSQNEHHGDGVLFKMRHDPRVTRTGRLLRRTSLDELPQLLNVVSGSMSLIGPRPALPHEVAGYDHTARRRLAVRPGMTGLWQVSGRSSLTWEQSIGFDLDYVDNWSARTDAAIALRTVKAVLSSDGAY
jgi:exopolysaccharide biosynthesis polyprenyl glycosylphosphotransferase